MNSETTYIDAERCTLCGICVDVCTRGIIEMGDASAGVKDPSRCIFCGHCKSACPEDAPVLPALNGSEFIPVPTGDQMPDPDALLGFFRSRRSIRLYKKAPVEREKLEKIVQAGRFIPTGGNRQPIHFVILHSSEMIRSVRMKTFSHRQSMIHFQMISLLCPN